MQGISSHLSFTGQYNAKTIAAVFLNDKKPGSGKSTGAPNGRVNALVAELNAPNASQELRNRSPGLAKVRIPKTN
ncbi:MAG: hypothetical protein KAQ92_01580, partial [Candidatus Aenigmarchaeota archaeon]|nr:hypothetical protein [Candidatus Aenigmarchaeota archaeon]